MIIHNALNKQKENPHDAGFLFVFLSDASTDHDDHLVLGAMGHY